MDNPPSNGLPALLLFFCIVFGQSVSANPRGGVVAAGLAEISSSQNEVIINQNSANAIVSWDSFNIAAHEKTTFVQPPGGITLNRINSSNGCSEILGNLNANGSVILVNNAGILFGKGAQVNVGGIIAATGDITNENFLNNKLSFENISRKSQIINEGSINATNGLVALLGATVKNSGHINAKLGKVLLANGRQITIDLNGDDLICFAVAEPLIDDKGGVTEAISHTGNIDAPGGYVLLSANAAEGVLDNTLNMSGVISANTMENQNGKVVLVNENSKVTVYGKIQVNSSAIGGEIQVLGKDIVVAASAELDASGADGGGIVLIGGDYKGQNSAIINADNVSINPEAQIRADALHNGNGGRVIVWSDECTTFEGSISARGGPYGGNGGFVEVSSSRHLNYSPHKYTDTTAPFGTTGTLLLDPQFLIVATAGGVAYSDGVNNLFANNAGGTNTLTPASIVSAAVGANITLQANTDVTFNNALAIATSGRTLTVQAGRSILQNANVSTTNGAILFSANDTAAISGDRQSGSGSITMGSGATLSSGTASLTLAVGASSVAPFSPGDITALGLTGGAISIATPNALSATTIAASTSLSVDVGATSTISGIISGTGATLTKLGSGLLNLTAANTYTGATNVNVGTLRASNASAFGSTAGGVTVADGASIEINGVAIGTEAFTLNGAGVGSAGALIGTGTCSHTGTVVLASDSTVGGTGTFTQSGIVSGAFNVTKVGSGTTIFSAANTYTGNTLINEGTFTASNATALGPVASGSVTVASGATLNLNAVTVGAKPFSISGTGVGGVGALIGTGTSSHSGTIAMLADSSIGGTGNTLTLTGILSGAFNLTKAGSGTLNLNAANTYSGTTLVSAGTLGVGNATGMGSNVTTVTVADGARISIGAVAIGAKPMSISGSGIGGTGALLGSGTGSYAGTITMTDNTTFGGTGNTTTLSGIISGAFNITKVGTGTFILSNVGNTFDGNLAINAGTIRVSSDGNLGTAPGAATPARITLGGGTLQATAAFTINSNRGISLTTSTTSTIQSDVSSLTYNGIIAGSGNLNKTGAGIFALGGSNSFTGSLAINAGTLSLTTVDGIAAISALSLANVSGASLLLNNNNQTIGSLSGGGTTGGTIQLGSATLTINQTAAGTYAGAISGTGNLSLGSGSTNTLTLGSTTSTFSGATSINGGTLSISADSNLGAAPGVVTPAKIVLNNGTLLANSSFTLNSNRGITLNGDSTIQVQPGVTLTYGGIITGAFGLTKAGSGTLSSSAVHTYTGATNINAGTLLLNSANQLANSNSIIFADVAGATLDCNGFNQTFNNLSGGGVNGGLLALGSGNLTINQTVDATFAGEFTGSGDITLSTGSANTLALTNSSSGFTGSWNLSGGTLSISSDNNLGASPVSATPGKVSFNGGTLATTADFSLSSTRGIAILTGGATFSTNPATTLTYGGIIAGSSGGALNKNGTGTLVLSGANTYDGATNINAGKLSLTNSNALGSSSGTIVSTNAQLDINFNSATLANTNTINLNGTGLSSSGALTFSGSFITMNNPLSIASTTSIKGSGVGSITMGGTISANNPLTITLDNSSLILPTVNMSAAFAATASGSITQTGAITGSFGSIASFGAATANTDIILDQANNFGSSSTFIGTVSNIRDVYYRDIGLASSLPSFTGLTGLRNLTVVFNNSPLEFPAITLNGVGALSATAGGAITQSGILSIPGTSSFNSGNNLITLNQNNGFIGAVSLNNSGANDASIINATSLNLAASSIGRNLSATANGSIVQSGILTVGGTSSFNSGVNDINLSLNNALTGAISLNNSGANAAVIRNSNSTVLGTVNVGQDFAITSGGNITQTGIITASGGATSFAITLPNSDITLNLANDFGGIAPIFSGTRSNIRDVYFRNVNSAAQSPSFTGMSSLRNLTLEFNNSALSIPTITLHSSGNFIAVSGGAVTQTGALTVPGTTNVSAGSNSISLNQNNQLQGVVILNNNGTNNVSVNNATNLNLGASTVGNDLSLIASGSITQSGILTVPGKSSFTSGSNTITLTANNLFTGSISFSNSGANDIAIKNTLPTVIGDVSAGSNISLISGGTISQSKPIIATGGALDLAVTAANSSILLPENNDFGSNAVTFSGTKSFITNLNLKNISPFAATPSFTGLSNLHYLEMNYPNQTIALSNLALSGTAIFYGNNVTGNLNVHGLQLDTNFCNLTGFVNGLAGTAAIEQIVLLNTISAGTHFFDGIDMFGVEPTPGPSPSPTNSLTPTQRTLLDNALYISDFYWNQNKVIDLSNYYDKTRLENRIVQNKADKCTSYGSDIEVCI